MCPMHRWINLIFYFIERLRTNSSSCERYYTITAKVVNPFNGLRQGLKFKFATTQNKIGDMVEISDGNKSVAPNNLVGLEDIL